MPIERAPSRYAARANWRLPGGDESAEVVGRELEVIAAESGGITAAAVVERATTAGTPLYAWDQSVGYFEHDDAAAAAKHREAQARRLIRAIVVKVESGDESLSTRGFYVVGDHQGVRSYQPINSISVNDEASAQIVDRFQNELIRLDREYRAYLAYTDFKRRFEPVFEAVEKVVDVAAEQGNPVALAAQKQRYRVRGGRVALVSNQP